MADKSFKPGDTVAWTHSQGRSTGKVVRRLTHPTKIGRHEVAATPEKPEYLVESDTTGARAAHRPGALKPL